MRAIGLVLLVAVAACGSVDPPPASDRGAPSPVPVPPVPSSAPDAGVAEVDAGADEPLPSLDAVRRSLFLDDVARAEVAACADVPCLLRLRYAADPEAARAAEGFFTTSGAIAGLEPASDFDGGWRGKIRIVPELPVGKYRRHLVDAAAAVERLDALLDEVRARAKRPVRYRARGITFRFFRSVNRTTPSAFAEKWSIAYNVSGSLLGSAAGVHETLVHEIFHLNDEGRGESGANWSTTALGPTFDAIVSRCGTATACLAPFAPATTMVKGGTFYAFQPGGGVHEYAAEVAVRYVEETEAALGTGPKRVAAPFKCGPRESSRVWEAVVEEFFGGVDLTATCP
jgi:hypothetical protein